VRLAGYRARPSLGGRREIRADGRQLHAEKHHVRRRGQSVREFVAKTRGRGYYDNISPWGMGVDFYFIARLSGSPLLFSKRYAPVGDCDDVKLSLNRRFLRIVIFFRSKYN